MYIYKFRAIEGDNKNKYGDSSANTKWSKEGGTVFLDKPASLKACKRQARLANEWQDAPPHKKNVKCEIVKFTIKEIETITDINK